MLSRLNTAAIVLTMNTKLATGTVQAPSVEYATEAELQILATNPYYAIRVQVAENDKTPEDALLTLAADTHEKVQLAVSERRGLSDKVLLTLLNNAKNEILETIYRHHARKIYTGPVELVQAAANSDNSNLRAVAAGATNATAGMLNKLVLENDSTINDILARNENITKFAIQHLSENADVDTKIILIERKALTEKQVKNLLENPISRMVIVKILVYYDSLVSEAQLEQYSKDEEHVLLRTVVAQRTRSQNLLMKLSADPHPDVLRAVAVNPACDYSVLLNLAKNEECFTKMFKHRSHDVYGLFGRTGTGGTAKMDTVAEAICYTGKDTEVQEELVTFEILETLIATNPNHGLQAALKHPAVSVVRLWAAVDSDKKELWYSVAQNPNTSAEMLTKLYQKTKDELVLEKLVRNPNTPSRLLDSMSRETEWEHSISVHPNTSLDTLKRLVARGSGWPAENPNCSEELLWKIVAMDKRGVAGQAVAANPNSSPELLTFLWENQESQAGYSHVRGTQRCVLKNPKIAVDLFEKILQKHNNSLFLISGALRNPAISEDHVLKIAGFPNENIRGAILDENFTPELLTKVFTVMENNSLLTPDLAIAFLEKKVPLSQANLLLLVELFGKPVAETIEKLNIEITNPLLMRTVDLETGRGNKHRQLQNSTKMRDLSG